MAISFLTKTTKYEHGRQLSRQIDKTNFLSISTYKGYPLQKASKFKLVTQSASNIYPKKLSALKFLCCTFFSYYILYRYLRASCFVYK